MEREGYKHRERESSVSLDLVSSLRSLPGLPELTNHVNAAVPATDGVIFYYAINIKPRCIICTIREGGWRIVFHITVDLITAHCAAHTRPADETTSGQCRINFSHLSVVTINEVLCIILTVESFHRVKKKCTRRYKIIIVILHCVSKSSDIFFITDSLAKS